MQIRLISEGSRDTKSNVMSNEWWNLCLAATGINYITQLIKIVLIFHSITVFDVFLSLSEHENIKTILPAPMVWTLVLVYLVECGLINGAQTFVKYRSWFHLL